MKISPFVDIKDPVVIFIGKPGITIDLNGIILTM